MIETEILAAVLRLPSDELRAEYLDLHCGHDSQLRDRIAQMLELDKRLFAMPLLTTAASHKTVGMLHAKRASRRRIERRGDRVGPYRLLQMIAEGGMGSVWRAEQSVPVQREVAIKVIKVGMDTREVIARFETERQALALMNHPNIANVLDAGSTESGRPYFVMELVDGKSISEYCISQKLSLASRLKLFVDVCEAVQHSHLKGIIHRDIKPSNVLVAMRAGQPVVKVIDFGLAKATGQEISKQIFHTATGQFMGTPSCMSPEQAGLSTHDIDSRTDVYSLGVLLYEMLTGFPVFDFKSKPSLNQSEMLRIIREQEPLRMSSRLISSVMNSRQRGSIDAGQVLSTAQSLRGDLDIIVQKALEKDRERRYQTPRDFAADISRYLRNEAIQARPASVAYRVKKMFQRNRAAVAFTSLLLLSLLAGIIASTSLAIRAIRAERVSAARLALATTLSQQAEARTRVERWERYRSNMSAVGRALGGDQDLSLAERSLASAPSEYRGWEWYHYAGQLDGAQKVLDFYSSGYSYCPVFDVRPTAWELAIQRPDGSPLTWELAGDHTGDAPETSQGNYVNGASRIVYSPDGSRLAVAADDHSVHVWDRNTLQLLCQLQGHTDSVLELAFTPDGKRLLTGGEDHEVRCWEVDQGALLFARTNESSCRGLAFCHSGAQAWICSGKKAELVLIDDNRVLVSLDGHAAQISAMALSQNGLYLATGGSDPDNMIHVWDASTGDKLATMIGHTNQVNALKFCREDSRIASASLDRTLRVWNAQDGSSLAEMRGHSAHVYCLDVSPDGRRLVSGSLDATVRIWNLDSGELLRTLRGHSTQIPQVSFSPDASQIASSAFDGTIRIWDSSPEKTSVLRGHQRFVYDVTFNPAGTQLASVAWDGTLRIWAVADGRQIDEFEHTGDVVNSVAFDSTGKRLVTSSRPTKDNLLDNQLTVWDLKTGTSLCSIPIPGTKWFDCRAAFNRGGHIELNSEESNSPLRDLIATGSDGGDVYVFDATSAKQVATLKGHVDAVLDVAFSPDGRRLASAGRDQTIRVWDLGSHQTIRELHGAKAEVSRIAYNRDGSRLAAISNLSSVLLWDCHTGQLIAELPHGVLIYGLSFSPDGKRLATGCADETIRLWDLEKHQEVSGLQGHQDYVHAVAFSPDGTRLASASGDGTVRMWTSALPRASVSQSNSVASSGD